MRDLFMGGKICVVAIPTQGSGGGNSPSEGKIANGLMQFCFCRAATESKRKRNVFLVSDECQETISHELQRQLSVMREYRVATVLLSQDLAALDARLGEKVREAVLSKCETKVFLRQNHAATREWAAEQIGKRLRETLSQSRDWNPGGMGHGQQTGEDYDWRVRPDVFARLKNGGPKNGFIVESILLKAGEWHRLRWHQKEPGRNGTVRVA
jgi:hypothetical protein